MQVYRLSYWLMSLLVLYGGLIACSPAPTPIAIATATVIPSTATTTPTPVTPSATPLASNTPISLATDSPIGIVPILETEIEIDIAFTQMIIADLASSLDISENRIQLISVESALWDAASLGCIMPAFPFDDPVINRNNTHFVDGLRYLLLVGNSQYEYHTEGIARFIQCEGREIIRDEVLLAVDPLASEILRVVQDLLAEDLDLSTRRIQLVTMQPVTWRDTSLGCPQPEQTYRALDIPGYHIVVQAGTEQYIFHSDSNTVYACPAQQSVIPLE